MNAITYAFAISFFPKATFEERVNCICTNNVRLKRKTRVKEALLKYERRGWKRRYEFDQYDNSSPDAPVQFGPRWLEDRFTWRIPLRVDYIETQPYSKDGISQDPFLLNGFSLIRRKSHFCHKTTNRANVVCNIEYNPTRYYDIYKFDPHILRLTTPRECFKETMLFETFMGNLTRAKDGIAMWMHEYMDVEERESITFDVVPASPSLPPLERSTSPLLYVLYSFGIVHVPHTLNHLQRPHSRTTR